MRIADLTAEQLTLVADYVEMFGISEEEALAQALAEGAIGETQASVGYKPEGYNELKYHVINNKSNYYKINKELKKNKKPEMFEDEVWYYNPIITKNEDGSYDLDKCSAVEVKGNPRIIVTKIAYRGSRSTFDAQGKAEVTNFESTLQDSLYLDAQAGMIAQSGQDKGKSVLDIINKLKKDYPADDKSQKNVPAALKVKFRNVLFGLIEIDGKWEKFFLDLSNRYTPEENLITEYMKISGMKSRKICELQITGNDSFQNPIIQVLPTSTILTPTEFKELAPTIQAATRDVTTFIDAQKAANTKSKTAGKPSTDEVEEDDGDMSDPFED